MKKKLLLTTSIFILVILLAAGGFQIAKSRTFQFFGHVTDQVQTTEKVVALTFDDGPTKNVDKLLPILEKYQAKATFFLIGKDIENYPEGVTKIAEAGHQIGNHSYSHERMVLKSPSFMKEEIKKTDQLIQEHGYDGDIDFRPPYGKKFILLPYFLKKEGKETIMWNLEPDTFYTDSEAKVNYVRDNVTPGSIILMHPMYDEAALEAVEGVLQSLTEEGYTFVTVEELMKK